MYTSTSFSKHYHFACTDVVFCEHFTSVPSFSIIIEKVNQSIVRLFSIFDLYFLDRSSALSPSCEPQIYGGKAGHLQNGLLLLSWTLGSGVEAANLHSIRNFYSPDKPLSLGQIRILN